MNPYESILLIFTSWPSDSDCFEKYFESELNAARVCYTTYDTDRCIVFISCNDYKRLRNDDI